MRQTKPGSALLLATLAATLLAGAASIMLIDARAARASMGETLRLERARLEAQRYLAMALVRLDNGGQLAAQGELFADQTGARVWRQDASGLVDVNAATPEQLVPLLIELGEDAATASMLADRIADWRDDDDLVRANGAERTAYEDANLPPPGNRNFTVETEISAVLGMTPSLVKCLTPFLTTYSGGSHVDLAAAPPVLRRILGGNASPGLDAAPPFGRVILLSADAPLSAHAVLRVSAWMRLTGDPRRPFVVHRATEEFAPRADVNETACSVAPGADA